MSRPKKYNKNVANTIFELLRADTYTVAEICRMVKIAPSTFYSWRSSYSYFLEGIKQAEAERTEILQVEAEKSLLKLIKGYTITETEINTVGTGKYDVNGKEIAKVKGQKTRTKYIQPDTSAVLFTLCNTQPTKWKKYQTTEITGKDGKTLFENLSDKELASKINDLERRLKQ